MRKSEWLYAVPALFMAILLAGTLIRGMVRPEQRPTEADVNELRDRIERMERDCRIIRHEIECRYLDSELRLESPYYFQILNR